MGRSSKMSAIKRQRERKKTEKASIKRDRKQQRREEARERTGGGDAVASREELEAYGVVDSDDGNS